MISPIDPLIRHGYKTSHRGFDGYKDHLALVLDGEIIIATQVTAVNTGDVEPAADLITDHHARQATRPSTATVKASNC